MCAATAGMGPSALPLEKPASRAAARKEAPAPAPEATEEPAAEQPAAAAGGNGSATRWTRTREVPSFALVSNEDRTGHKARRTLLVKPFVLGR